MKEKTYQKNLAVWIVITIVLMGGAFYVGAKHGKAAAQSAAAGMRGQFTGGMRNRFGGGGGISGDVTAKDDTSVTVKSRDGSSRIILYSGTTQIFKSTTGTISDVAVGEQISAQGTQNTDGSITAQSIQIRPAMPMAKPTGTQ